MKPTWGLVAAMALLVVSVFVLGNAGRLYFSGAAPYPHFTDAQVKQELQWFRDNVPTESASR